MAQEGTTFIIDGSHSLIQSGQYDCIIKYLEFTFLEKCKKMRKTDYTSFLISNTYEERNDEEIEDIVQLCSCEAPMNGELFKKIMHEVVAHKSVDKLQETDEGSTVLVKTMLVSNIQMRQIFGTRKVKRQLMIFSDNLNGLDIEEEHLNLINEQFEVTRIILVNCSNNPLSPDSEWNVILERQRSNGLNPILVTMNELSEKINKYATPLVKPIRIFSGELRFGADTDIITNLEPRLNQDAFEDKLSLCMTVEGYPATKAVSGLSRKMMIKEKTFISKAGEEDTKKEQYIPAKSIIEYELHQPKVKEDDSDVKVKEEVWDHDIKFEDKDDKKYDTVVVGNKNITKAYRYGLDYVVLPPTLLPELQYHCSPGIDIRGFAPRTSLPRQYLTSESIMIIPDTRLGHLGDVKAFAALVDVMLEHDKIAIARYVNKFDGNVNMVCLCPIKASTENIVDIISEESDGTYDSEVKMMILTILPFAEDIKHMSFPRLLNPHTSSGKAIKKEVKEEEKEEDKLMQSLMASMDTDELPSVKFDQVYKHYSECNKTGTVIPLPDSINESYDSDPTIKPHLTLQYKNQALSSWILEKYLFEGSSVNFTPPLLSKEQLQIMEPHINKHHILSQEEKERMKKIWITKKVTPNKDGNKDNKSWIATEEGPSQFEFL